MTACPPIKMTRLNLAFADNHVVFFFGILFFRNYTSTESKGSRVKRHGWLCTKPYHSAALDLKTVAPKFILPRCTICLLFPLGINKENQSANYDSSVAVVTIMCSCQMKRKKKKKRRIALSEACAKRHGVAIESFQQASRRSCALVYYSRLRQTQRREGVRILKCD